MPPLSPEDQQGVDAAARGAATFVDTVNDVILFPLIALLSGIAFLVFLWGCAQYIMNADSPAAREDGTKHIMYGIIGLVVMMSAWAILSIVAATFGLNNDLQDIRNTPINQGVDGAGSGGGSGNTGGVYNPGNSTGGGANPGNTTGGGANPGI